eukprot:364054-Chlamydomonas_euryale.AAC.3
MPTSTPPVTGCRPTLLPWSNACCSAFRRSWAAEAACSRTMAAGAYPHMPACLMLAWCWSAAAHAAASLHCSTREGRVCQPTHVWTDACDSQRLVVVPGHSAAWGRPMREPSCARLAQSAGLPHGANAPAGLALTPAACASGQCLHSQQACHTSRMQPGSEVMCSWPGKLSVCYRMSTDRQGD